MGERNALKQYIMKKIANRKWMLEHPTAAKRLKTAGKVGAVTGVLGAGSFAVYKAKKAIQNRAKNKKRG